MERWAEYYLCNKSNRQALTVAVMGLIGNISHSEKVLSTYFFSCICTLKFLLEMKDLEKKNCFVMYLG